MKPVILFTVVVIAAAACAPATQSSPSRERFVDPVVTDTGLYIGDPELYRLLAADSVNAVALGEYEYRVGTVFMDRVGEVAEDSLAPAMARIQALRLIDQRRDIAQFTPVRAALHARDPRVRATALATAATLNTAGYSDAVILLREALFDSAPEIQAKALQLVGDDDIVLLRQVVDSTSPGQGQSVARDMLRALEERGAPLAPDSQGVLARTSVTGHTVRFVPTQRWPQWDAAAGRVTIETADGDRHEIAGMVEAVAGVVPVFFSSDGRYAVYEAARNIHVMDLATGEARDVGAGIAPRVMPFTEKFLFLRADGAGPAVERNISHIRYQVLGLPFAGGAAQPDVLGEVRLELTQGRHGNYSPARWMWVNEEDGAFFLSGNRFSRFPLPSPFAGLTDN